MVERGRRRESACWAEAHKLKHLFRVSDNTVINLHTDLVLTMESACAHAVKSVLAHSIQPKLYTPT